MTPKDKLGQVADQTNEKQNNQFLYPEWSDYNAKQNPSSTIRQQRGQNQRVIILLTGL